MIGTEIRTMPVYLTFDIGTTALKTALIDPTGQLLAVHVEEYAFNAPQADWAEMEPEVYWLAAITGARSVLKRAESVRSEQIVIGFSSQGQTFIPIDRDGKHLYNAIVWTDTRAQDVADEWETSWLSRDEFRRITGYPWLPAGLAVFKIAWLAREAPDVHRAWKFLCLPDYIIYCLTGETVTDHVTAQFNGLFDLRNNTWEPRFLEATNITSDQLPYVVPSGTVVGNVLAEPAAELGIPTSSKVCAGANDQIAGALGAGNVKPGIVTETTGTALAVVATTPSLLEDTRMVVGRHAAKDRFFAMPFTITSAIVLKWFRDLCEEGISYDSFLKGVENVAPGCDGLTVLPHFAGTASPTFNHNARGVFAGLALGHTRAHIARAIMESCCCLLQECVELIIEHGLDIRSIRSLGGAARNDLWLQMKADMLGVEVERPECSDAASLGAAVLAAVGTGAFGSIEEASESWYRPARVFEPNPSLYACYRDIYERYLDIYRRLYG